MGGPEGVDAVVCKFLSVPSHRLRFGQVDREPWRTANGLLQDCPASPDPLNLLLEYFHHWGVAAGPGAVAAPDYHVASVRFAEDVDLVAKDQAVLEALIGANLQWCALLGVSVSKCRSGQICRADWSAGLEATSPTFRIFGAVLGANEQLPTNTQPVPHLTAPNRSKSCQLQCTVRCGGLRSATGGIWL